MTTNNLGILSYPRTGKRGVPQQFPRRLYLMLESEAKLQATSSDHIDNISWSASGKAFRIVDVESFASEVLPKYFRTSKFSSFQRNLNLVSVVESLHLLWSFGDNVTLTSWLLFSSLVRVHKGTSWSWYGYVHSSFLHQGPPRGARTSSKDYIDYTSQQEFSWCFSEQVRQNEPSSRISLATR